MEYFNTRKVFLVPYYDISEEEETKLFKFFNFLEKTGVGKVIEKYVKNNKGLGGRPNVNYYNLFAAILYGFCMKRFTLREIEDACKNDLRFITIMERTKTDYSTISKFIKKVIVPNADEIFSLINKQIKKEMGIVFEDAFLDGSKYEAKPNKYKFVWKPLTFHRRISNSFFHMLEQNGVCKNIRKEELVKSKTIVLAIEQLQNSKNMLSEKQYEDLIKGLQGILLKVLEYEEKENICGDGRNSYYKTDKDATAMCLKQDYYSGLGTNMHAAYNVQIIVVEGLVFSYYVSSSRSDISDFIPILDKFYELYEEYPQNLCADAGYGSLSNYRYLKEHDIMSFVKHQSWEGNVSGKYPTLYRLNDDKETITCLGGNIGIPVTIPGRHTKTEGGKLYKVNGCNECPFKQYCLRHHKNQNVNERIFEINPIYQDYKQETENNLLSRKGIEIRVNRSIQVEGAFGNEKYNQQYSRIRRTGIENVNAEIMLSFLGMNIKKLFKYYSTGEKQKKWEIAPDIEPQKFKKPSAKRLSKKGERIHSRQYEKIQQA